MSQPKRQTIDQLRKNKSYKFAGTQQIQVYPGWGERYIFVSLEDGTYWATNVYMSDDESDGDQTKEWFRAYPKQETKYYAHDELPEVIEQRNREYAKELKARKAEELTPEQQRERAIAVRAKWPKPKGTP